MLTLEMLKKMPPNTIFATGTLIDDDEDGLFMTNSGKLLRWVAVRGGIDDFCIYCYFAENSAEWIRDYGDKVTIESNIKKCVPCDDEAFKRYRY